MKHSTLRWLGGVITLLAIIFTIVDIPSTYAVPAKKGLISITQPDGSKIAVNINGDEHFNWRTLESGYPITRGEDGYYYYAQYSSDGGRAATSQRVLVGGRLMAAPSNATTPSAMKSIAATRIAERIAVNNATTRVTSDSASAFPNIGDIKSAIILVEFADLEFVIENPNTAFYNQLNQEGYSVSGATGSAKDYYYDNSNGLFNGQFDVYGPYKLSQGYSYYGGSTGVENVSTMIEEAVQLADNDGVDFSQYDFDENGEIDNIFVYYAGYNAAEGGPEGCVWPHKSSVSSKPIFDGKKLYVYACTSELRDNKGETIAGIGTFCHEFGHVFGLVDIYDIDYSASGGTSTGLGTYCIMCEGAYNNDGNTPPMFNALSLEMIGWSAPKVLEAGESITIRPVQHLETYMIETEVEGEFFLVENRNIESIVWDTYIPASGLLITHIDRSDLVKNKWSMNTVNSDPDHDCVRFVPAGTSKITSTNWEKVPFPYGDYNSWTGSDGLVKAASWAGINPSVNIINITRDGSENISFNTISSVDGSLSVVITKEFDEYYSYVGDILQLNVEVLPSGSSQEVTWSSSDESIATITASGVATIAGTGEVTITATSVEDPTYSGSMTLHAVELNGLRGYVNDTNGNHITSATLDFYAVNQSVVNNVTTYTRATDTAAYSTKTDSSGQYRIELDEGTYEVEINCDQFVSLFEVVSVSGNGIADKNFTLSSYSETVEGLDMLIGQSEATFTWNPQGYDSFRIILSSSVSMTVIVEVDDCRYDAESLKSATEYSISIEGIDDGVYTDLYSTSFTTLSKITTLPIINLPTYDGYSADDTLELKALNVVTTDILTWIVDGVELRSNKVNLEAGDHTIKCEVDRDGVIYTTTRFINVK